MTDSKRKRIRKREEVQQLARKHRRQNWLIAGGVSLMLVALVGLILYDLTRPEPGMAMQDLGNLHIQPPATVTYNGYPPTSGPHYTNIADWGIHKDPIPNELQVHNLEDGGVMVQYNCQDGCSDLVGELAAVVARYDSHVILAPYPDMEARIALTAWNRIDKLDTFDEARIVAFIEAYREVDHHQ